MASRKKKASALEASGNPDPRAALDGAALLDAAKPLLKTLAVDLLARADGSAAVTSALQARHAAEQKAQRTADGYPEWRRAFVEQVAAAWLLSCVFVRTLEDRGLLGKNRIAGAGALDSWRAFQQLAPSLSEREYLLTVFRELSRFPAAADLFDVRHNPVWLLAPSAEGARQLLELFRSPSPDAPTFRFGGEDTRFLGDLYQDLSEDVRKRYALLQTPRFVERFILDRTLEPAIERFGLDDTNLIDPTCGSGHFLLGAFERLFDHRLRAQPGLSAREAATKALDAVAGADINPYAVAVARFRLTLAFIEKCGINRLRDVPRLPLHLAVADSLLYNPQIGQLALVAGTDPAEWEGTHFSLEDPAAARDVLFKAYAAVVGNPPYITVKDAVLRDRYRDLYSAAYREYSLAVPFLQRFFQLGRKRAFVGTITANSFMKREFGTKIIEEFFPTINLEMIANTSGAYVPGHGTPTVLLFGTCEKATGADVLAVLANRGEPTTPESAELGVVWSSIADHWDEIGFENEYISVVRLERRSLAKHPWSLGGGGAVELKELLELRAGGVLSDVVESIGFSVITGEDNVLMQPRQALARSRLGQFMRRNVVGEEVRDWAIADGEWCVWPNNDVGERLLEQNIEPVLRYLWPWRASLQNRKAFGAPIADKGIPWWALREVYSARMRTPLTITFAFVATHNHFVLDRGGKVFNRSAPIIKLPETATEDDHLALLAYLNSSTACFWMKQVFHDKGSGTDTGKWQSEPAKIAYEFAGTGMASLPVPEFSVEQRRTLIEAALSISRLSEERSGLVRNLVSLMAETAEVTSDAIASIKQRDESLLASMVQLQELIDWTVYAAFGLCDPELAVRLASAEMRVGLRPFEVLLARNGVRFGIDGQSLDGSRDDVDTFVAAIRSSRDLALIESPDYKRRWLITPKHLAGRVLTFEDRLTEAAAAALADTCEKVLRHRCQNGKLVTRREVIEQAAADTFIRSAYLATRASISPELGVAGILESQSVPYLASWRFSERGLEKFARWLVVREAQRGEDMRVDGSVLPAPHYLTQDFRSAHIEELRGKLDVPKERFISYPGCESDEDKEPVYGWAGWDHLQRAVALAALYQDRKQREGWSKDRLQPMLAGLLELLPWLKQWHHEPSAELGGERPSDQFEAFLNAECSEHGFTHDDLRAWRPAAKTRGAAKRKPKEQSASAAEPESADADGAS
jgi:hypothetical protein